MEKKLSDYLHLYLGCPIRFHSNLTGTWGIWNKMTCSDIELANAHIGFGEKCQIQLRPLSDMMEDEFEEFKKICDEDFDKMTIVEAMSKEGNYTRLCHTYFHVPFLLSKHFDLFGLIESGLAIDITTLNTNQ